MRRSNGPFHFASDALKDVNALLLQFEGRTFLIVLIGCLGFGSAWFFLNVGRLEIGDVFSHIAAWICVHWLGWPGQSIPIKTDSGWQYFYAQTVLQTEYVASSVTKANRHALIAAGIATAMFASFSYFIIWLKQRNDHNAYSDRVAHDTPIATPRKLKRAVRKAGASNIRICDAPLPETALNQHILLLGSTRSGKSLSIRRILREIERRGDMAIVVDKVGDFVCEFYQPGRQDLLMNPLDRRSDPWSPWCEGDRPTDYMHIARSMIPKHPNDKNIFDQQGARELLVALLSRIGQMKNRSIESFLEVAHRWDLGRKARFLKGAESAKRFNSNSNAGHNIDATLGAFTQSLRYLPRDSGSGKDRSIRSFIRDVIQIKEEGPEARLAEIENINIPTEQQKRRDEINRLTEVINTGRTPWMFISVEPEKMDALVPLISCWIDLAITSVLSLHPCQNRRVWIILDEWHTLGKLNHLQDVLTDGAKFGASVVAGTQNVGQIKTNYGYDATETMLSLFSTKAVFRLTEPVSAEWASRHMEDLTFKNTYSAVKHKAVPYEFFDLPDCTAYLSITGDFPITKVKTAFDRKTDAAQGLRPAFVPRTFEELAWGHSNPPSEPRSSVNVARTSTSKQNTEPKARMDHPFAPGCQDTNVNPDLQRPHRNLPPSGQNDDLANQQSRPVGDPNKGHKLNKTDNPDRSTRIGSRKDVSTDNASKKLHGLAAQPQKPAPINPHEQFNPLDRKSLIKKIQALSAEGFSIRQIAKQLNVSKSTVHRLLSEQS